LFLTSFGMDFAARPILGHGVFDQLRVGVDERVAIGGVGESALWTTVGKDPSLADRHTLQTATRLGPNAGGDDYDSALRSPQDSRDSKDCVVFVREAMLDPSGGLYRLEFGDV
jgi:hypothetical protein